MIIGIIGPKISCEKIRDDLQVISPQTEVYLYVREPARDAIQVIEQCEKECDAVLFTGRAIYSSVVRRYQMKIPYEYIDKGVASLTRAFLDMQKAGFELDCFSIDVADIGVIEDAFAEMDISPKSVFSMPFDSYEEKEYIDWHLERLNKHKTKAILTGFVWMYDYFKTQGYPVFYLPTMRSVVRATFHQLQARFALEEAHASQIAVEILMIGAVSEDAEKYYSNKMRKSRVESAIIEYSQKIQGSFFCEGRYEYIIFANRGSVKKEENYRDLYKLQSQILSMGLHLNIGIGVSVTGYQSESNARKALQHSIQTQENYIFMINENDNIVGPLGKEQELEYALISADVNVLEISKKTGMSVTSISKLMSIIGVRRNAIFDMEQLADCLHISSRSARRIANKLIEAGYALICAKESGEGGGRPKNLVEISFDKGNSN